jgi:hypothetical protein
MADPPPYNTADAPFILTWLPEYIHYREYPKLCLVSASWRDVFQSLLWSQPDRYFSTENRSVNSNFFMGCVDTDIFVTAGLQKFITAFYTVRPQLLSHIIHLSLHDITESVYISLPTDFLSRLFSSSRYLRSLDLSPGFLISHPHIAAVRLFHRELTTLSLAGCQAFSSTSLTQFLAYFPNLRRLDLSGTSGVTPSFFTILPNPHLTAVRLRHQPFKINDSTIATLAQTLESNFSDLDLSFALKSITGAALQSLEQFCQARPPLYSSEAIAVDIGPGPRKLGIAYTAIPVISISHFVRSDMIHLVALDIAGIPNVPSASVDFWDGLRQGGSFTTLQMLRLDFPVFAANAGFNICLLPTRLKEFTLHNVPSVESTPPRVTRVLIMLFTDLRPSSPFRMTRLKVVNLEMAPKEDEQTLGMYGIEEREMGDEIDVIEEIKRWKRAQKQVWQGQIRAVRDVVGIRGYAQEFGSGVGDILGRWVSSSDT